MASKFEMKKKFLGIFIQDTVKQLTEKKRKEEEKKIDEMIFGKYKDIIIYYSRYLADVCLSVIIVSRAE